jgi:YD repeat-containing protein
MADNVNSGDKQVKESSDSNLKTSDNVATQTAAGREDLSKSTVDYYQSRRDGVRDRDTAEHLPPKPEFFDSIAAQQKLGGDPTQQKAANDSAMPEGKGSAGDSSAAKMGHRTLEQMVDSLSLPSTDKVQVTEATEYAGWKSESKALPADRSITRDKDGYVTSVTDKDGWKTQYKYDESGEVKEVDWASGTRAVKDGEHHWTVSDQFGNKREVNGDFKVTPNGDAVETSSKGSVVTHPDGSNEAKYPDGSVVSKDPHDRVTSIDHGQNGTDKITYDAQGNPTKVTSSDKSEWRKEADGWNKYENGKKTKEHADELDVNQDGSIVRRTKDGNVVRKERDGSTIEDTIGTVRDKDHRVTDVTYPDGTSKHIEYDPKTHEVASVKGPDGELYKKDGKWFEKDAKGNEYESDIKEVTTTPGGDIITKNSDGQTTEQRADGSKVQVNSDNSEIHTDKNGQITELKTNKGEVLTVEHDKQGHVTRLHCPDNSEWRRDKDGNYTKYDENNKPIEHLKGQIDVNDDGSMVGKGKDGTAFRQDLDGSFSERDKAGFAVTRDADGKVTNVCYPDHTSRYIEYDDKGKPNRIVRDDDSEWRKEGEGKWAKYDAKGKQVDTLKGDVEIDDNGNLMIKRDGKVVYTQKPNGQSEGEP